jgi:hypothetical protein
VRLGKRSYAVVGWLPFTGSGILRDMKSCTGSAEVALALLGRPFFTLGLFTVVLRIRSAAHACILSRASWASRSVAIRKGFLGVSGVALNLGPHRKPGRLGDAT